MSSLPGKTAPRLLQDLLTYDPRHEERAGRNLLTDAPPHFDPNSVPTAAVPYRNCRHNFVAKGEQSQLPQAGVDADYQTVYKIASLCINCFWHVDVVVDSRDAGSKNSPCSASHWPIHHFLHQHEDGPQDPFGRQDVPRSYRFECSAPKCPVDVRIRLRPPHLNDQAVSLMTNPVILRKRLEQAKQIDPDRADSQVAKPIEALSFLSTYLADSLEPQKGKSRIPLLNRKFLKTFGRDCNDVLRSLGFTQNTEMDTGEPVECWYLPRPPPPSHPLDNDTLRTTIIDSLYELDARILQIPEQERSNLRRRVSPSPSLTDIQRALGCLEYPKKPMSRVEARDTNHEEDHPYYAGLGAIADFADSLITFSYDRQVETDPINSTYYFECLQAIAIGRKSFALEEHVQIEASKGQINRGEVTKAYTAIGVDPGHAAILSDDVIIGRFRALMADISPNQQEEMRNMLRIIGTARQSEQIQREASNAIETYSQALAWLDLDEGQPDEFVTTMYAFKSGDSAANAEIAKKAVQIIADHRNSHKLREFLKTGEIESGEMDVGEAYALLGINDRSSVLDLGVLQAQLSSQIDDNMQNEAKYREAYDIVCEDQQKNHNNASYDFGRPAIKYPLETWPVGCQNIGNTCYLNSVLQFLFTIRPLRDMVLNFDEHKQEITPEALKGKRVGRSAVTLEKAERAQEFVLELRKLFQTMIIAPNDSIRPEEKLAYLALAKSDAIAQHPVETSAKGGGLGEIGGLPVSGPMPPPQLTNNAEPNPSPDAVTDAVMVDAPTDAASDSSSTKAMAGDDEDRKVEANGHRESEKPPPPSRPPPVPPRPQNNPSSNIDFRVAEGFAQQQDAAEILNNVFDLLSCAVESDETMEDGEQLDLIKKLFFSDVTTVRETKGKAPAINHALQDHCLIYPGDRDRHLYAALDDEFGLSDLDDSPSSQKYEIIKRPPPILIVNVRRLDFEQGRSKKIEFHVALDDTIFIDRYLDKTASMSKEDLLERRKKQWGLKSQLKTLEGRKAELNQTELKMSLADTVDGTAEHIESLRQDSQKQLVEVEDAIVSEDSNLPEQLQERSKELRLEAEDLDGKMKALDEQVNSLFEDCQDHPYQLHALFMHRGSATGGHYWIFIRDFQEDIWRKYNDERVDKVEDLKDIFTQEPKFPATSTGIVYIRKDKVLELTQAVNRAPATNPSPSKDVEMTDVNEEFQDVQVIDGVAKP